MIFGNLNQLSSQTSMIYLAHTAMRCLSSFPWPHFQTAVPWPFLCLSSHPLPSGHHPHQTPSLGPFISDVHVVIIQIQVRQTGVLFQGLGQSLAGDTWLTVRNTYRAASTFNISLMSLSYGGVLILPLQFLHTLSPHDTILTEQTKHQAFAPSGPMLFEPKFRYVRLEFCFKASARAWQETNDLRNTMKHTAHTYRKVAKCFHSCESSCISSHSHLKMLLPGSKNAWNFAWNDKSMGHQFYTALLICYTLHFYEALPGASLNTSGNCN